MEKIPRKRKKTKAAHDPGAGLFITRKRIQKARRVGSRRVNPSDGKGRSKWPR
jgi:hypothetical protein